MVIIGESVDGKIDENSDYAGSRVVDSGTYTSTYTHQILMKCIRVIFELRYYVELAGLRRFKLPTGMELATFLCHTHTPEAL